MKIELGKTQQLIWKRTTEHGAYLGPADSREEVLLPKKYLDQGHKKGDALEVFVYKDSEDRLVATTQKPRLELGGLALLEVAQISSIGAFLNWGLDKDLFLPFKEQTHKIKKGDKCLATLYLDKSSRLCATMKVYPILETVEEGQFHPGEYVNGVIYEIKPELGALVAVENRYHGMIPRQEFFQNRQAGDTVHARILSIRPDGKMNLTLRDKAYLQMDVDADQIMRKLEAWGGSMPFTDKTAPLVIQKEFGLSKNAFKRAVGRLMKEGKVRQTEDRIERCE